MDIFCNPKLVGNIYESKKKLRLQSNGGKILITHKAQVAGYNTNLWFKQKSITNFIALHNLTRRYQFTYNSLDEIFIVFQEEHVKNNIHFRMY